MHVESESRRDSLELDGPSLKEGQSDKKQRQRQNKAKAVEVKEKEQESRPKKKIDDSVVLENKPLKPSSPRNQTAVPSQSFTPSFGGVDDGPMH